MHRFGFPLFLPTVATSFGQVLCYSQHNNQPYYPVKSSNPSNPTMGELANGARFFEAIANDAMLANQLGPHLCANTRAWRFRGAFGCGPADVFICWSMLNVLNEGPTGGAPIHLLWTLLFLKTYDTVVNLAARCKVDKNTFTKWVNLFLARLGDLDLVSSVVWQYCTTVLCVLLCYTNKISTLLPLTYSFVPTDQFRKKARTKKHWTKGTYNSRWYGFSDP